MLCRPFKDNISERVICGEYSLAYQECSCLRSDMQFGWGVLSTSALCESVALLLQYGRNEWSLHLSTTNGTIKGWDAQPHSLVLYKGLSLSLAPIPPPPTQLV